MTNTVDVHNNCTVNHTVEWLAHTHVSDEDGGGCMLLVPHWVMEGVWAALNTFIGNAEVDEDGNGLTTGAINTRETFATLDEAYSDLDAWKHGELAHELWLANQVKL